jgi:hypothetical protein
LCQEKRGRRPQERQRLGNDRRKKGCIYIYWIYQLISVNVRFSTEGEKIVRAILSKFEFLFLIIFRNGLFFLEKIQDFTSLLAGFYFIGFFLVVGIKQSNVILLPTNFA